MTHPKPNKLPKIKQVPKTFDKTHMGKHIALSPDGKTATGQRVYGGYCIIGEQALTKAKNIFRVSILHTGI